MSERLYNLLPAIYRIRDAKEGEPLRALLGVIEEELRALEQDISGLYDDLFIETCDEWVIPYIGDLLGVHGVHPLSARAGSLRSYVANTIAYRRRKGTAAVLEQVARDITGWTAHAVEFFELLATTQHLNHLRMHNRTLDLRDPEQLELLGGPFESVAHTLDVHRIGTDGGKYNIPNIGIFLWRLQSYPLPRVTAREMPDNGYTFNGHTFKGYTFDPTGIDDIPLFNRPQTEREITHLAEEINVPGTLRRRPLYDELEAYRHAPANDEEPRSDYFKQKNPVFSVALIMEEKSQPEEIPPEEMLICDLSDWRVPQNKIIQVAVDPGLGRLVLSASVSPKTKDVLVSYSYGFSGDVGAGPYNRTAFIRKVLNRDVDWTIGVSQEESVVDNENIFGNLADAVAEWNKRPKGKVGVIAIMDSRTYPENLTEQHTIIIPEGRQLVIVAADWPVVKDPDKRRQVEQFAATGLRPHLLGNIEVSGDASSESPNPGKLVIDGLLIEGKITVQEGNLGSLQLAHCTLVPEKGGIEVLSSDYVGKRNDALKLIVAQTICGEVVLSDAVPSMCVTECIMGMVGRYLFSWDDVLGGDVKELLNCLKDDYDIDWAESAEISKSDYDKTIQITNDKNSAEITIDEERGKATLIINDDKTHDLIVKTENGRLNIYVGGIALDANGTAVQIERSTVLGSSSMRSLKASNSIFEDVVDVKQRQVGCMRFCVLPYASRTPRRFHCQPDLALADRALQLNLSSVDDLPEPEKNALLARLQPVFTRLSYGDPAYAQLSPACADEIRTGAEDSSEMGVFSTLQQPQREANLRAALDEYLRFGLEAGIFYVT